jgi:hypothetical protein
MRITIRTQKRVTDKDIRALYVLVWALNNSSSERMQAANLQYVADRIGYKLIKKS